MDGASAALGERKHYRARRPSGTQHQRGVEPMVPAWDRVVEVGEKTLDIGIGRAQRAALVPQRIRGADRLRASVGSGQGQCRLLVRHRDVGAHITTRGEI